MTPRGKRGKLKNPSEFSTLSTGLGNPAKGGRISTFPPRRRRVLTQPTGEKDGAATEFHLTIPVTASTMMSPASLRSDRDRHRVGISARDQIGITDRLHRNQHRLHVPLTIFAEEAVKRSSLGTARTYLNAAVPFFGWLEADDWQRKAQRKWNDAPERIRQAVHDYLVERLKCKVQEHRAGFQLVSLTEGTRSTVRVFLSALKLYYRVMRARSYYDYANPLVDSVSATLAQIE